jgi:hypothetical protein
MKLTLAAEISIESPENMIQRCNFMAIFQGHMGDYQICHYSYYRNPKGNLWQFVACAIKIFKEN